MFDQEKALSDKIEFYSQPSLVDDPYHPAGFRGTFKFSDHKLIPDVYLGFLQRYFGVMRLSRVSLDEINKVMNEVWEGPGSLTKLFNLEAQMRLDGRTIQISPADYVRSKKDEEEDEEEDLPLPMFEMNAVEDEDEDSN